MPSTIGIVASSVDPAAATPPVTDTFDRADSTTTLGTTDTGQAWTANVGTWGISTFRAYSVTAADGDLATVPFGSTNQRVSVTIIDTALSGGRTAQVVGRFSDVNNWYLGLASEGVTQIYRRVAGTITLVAGNTTTWAVGDVLTLVVNGSSLAILKNGTSVLTATDTTLTTGTRAGMRWGNSSALVRLNNFEVRLP